MDTTIVVVEIALIVLGYLILRFIGRPGLATDFYRLGLLLALFSWMIMLGMVRGVAVGPIAPRSFGLPSSVEGSAPAPFPTFTPDPRLPTPPWNTPRP